MGKKRCSSSSSSSKVSSSSSSSSQSNAEKKQLKKKRKARSGKKSKHKDKAQKAKKDKKNKKKLVKNKAKKIKHEREQDDHGKQPKKQKVPTESTDSDVATALAANMREIIFIGGTAFKDAKRPFGMELDGALVCDIADKGSAALTAGVQIGWRVVSVDRKTVPEETEGVAARILREAEDRAAAALAKDRNPIIVKFFTEDPQHWQVALARLKRGR